MTSILPGHMPSILTSRDEVEGLGMTVAAAKDAVMNGMQTLTGALANDLRAPLVAMSCFSQLLDEEYADELGENGTHYVRRIRAVAAQMHDMIDGLMTLAQLDGTPPARENVNLSALCFEVGEVARARWPSSDVEYHVQPGMTARADRTLVKLILSNLLQNAWKFTLTKPDAAVSVSCSRTRDGTCVYCVRDNGVGFDSAYAANLFKPFGRLHKSSEFPGTGLGLAIASKAVQLHGGVIAARSRIAVGSEFTFTLAEKNRPQTSRQD